ncbi:MAG: NADPH:quinone oxidoreductase family protein [Parahaliea sp.]
MQSVLCTAFGPIDNLSLQSVSPPVLAPGQVRIEVAACGVNFPDILIVQGKYQARPELPFAPGGEVAGVVSEVADDVSGVAVGQRVMATIFWGGMAEQAVVPANILVPVPEDMDFLTASVFQGGHTTAYYALKQRGRLRAGENLVVLGAAGGVGLAAVQVGKAMGARVIAAAGSEEKCAIARDSGADETINYSNEDLKSRIRALTAGQGADVILDPVGGEPFDQACRSINYEGRILVVGFASGHIPQYAANLALLKSCALVGVNYQAFFDRDRAGVEENFRELLQMVTQGRIAPRIDRVFPLAEAAQALHYVAGRKVAGKVVVTVQDL